ncbi:AAA family ATPase [Pseudokineococcus marinus]|nr:AAA family ATPase [Pseudokineococcus marinus]
MPTPPHGREVPESPVGPASDAEAPRGAEAVATGEADPGGAVPSEDLGDGPVVELELESGPETKAVAGTGAAVGPAVDASQGPPSPAPHAPALTPVEDDVDTPAVRDDPAPAEPVSQGPTGDATGTPLVAPSTDEPAAAHVESHDVTEMADRSDDPGDDPDVPAAPEDADVPARASSRASSPASSRASSPASSRDSSWASSRASASASVPAASGGGVAVVAGGDDAQRAEVAGSLPEVDDSTPLAREVADDARRRIALAGRPLAPPPRTRVLTVANQKGGVGKTTTTVNLAAALAQAGLRVVVLDSDPQGNASTALGVEHHAEVPGLYDVLVEEVPLEEVLQPCPDVPGLLCAPATIDLAGAEIELVSMVARETRLRVAVRGYLERCEARGELRPDYVFVDCPPSLGLLTLNAFVCAEEVLIPIQCEYYALEGLSQLLKNIDMITRHLNPGLHVSSILLTMYDARTRLAAQVAEEVREHFPRSVLRTTVPRSVRVSEAPSYGQTVMTYDPGSSGALSYLAAAQELAERPTSATAAESTPASGR